VKVFVTGGTGAIGRPAVMALVAAGHGVSALARSSRKAEDVSSIHVADGGAAVAAALRVSNAKLRRETGWAPRYRSAREGLMATARTLSDRR
jgi:nucleoside-diphosphate-sugar epimerase